MNKKLLSLILFSIAMAYLEASVVVYLRKIYYPDGFNFPLKQIETKMLIIEIGREIATILMIVSIAYIFGTNLRKRFITFLLVFGIWDIFYYVWLKILINWPLSLLDDDLLFLIPVPWVSPVIAPVIVSLFFILIYILESKFADESQTIKRSAILPLATGTTLILISFMWNINERIKSYSPVEFLWEVFTAGIILWIASLLITYRTKEKIMATEKLKLGSKAPDFSLEGVDGKTYSLDSFKEKEALIVIFSCNHCPYVQAYEDRIIKIQEDYAGRVQVVAINSNDDVKYPEDSFEEMKIRAEKKKFNFPYLRDETQETARAYGATHTPEIFLFDKKRELRFHGKIDDNWQEPAAVKQNYLRDALDELLSGKEISVPETFTIGCTIKWK
ncbi:thioredoxin family protein [Melioribacter sp. OK-6-Me]|uniref:thioredoxin family protein n=1 Tax=unclassified Melioribacter TaxID=2627329 RepID=UPI003ED9CB38